MPKSVANYTRNSPEFFFALKTAATTPDCVNPHNPLDISLRNRYIYDAKIKTCEARMAGLEYPQDAVELEKLYPPGVCLGTFCQFV